MFSVITNVYNKKTKGHTLMEFFKATGNLKKLLFYIYMCSMCAVSPVVHTSNISSCQKNSFSVFLWLWTIPLWKVIWFSYYKCL
jgi:hypothetical protein